MEVTTNEIIYVNHFRLKKYIEISLKKEKKTLYKDHNNYESRGKMKGNTNTSK